MKRRAWGQESRNWAYPGGSPKHTLQLPGLSVNTGPLKLQTPTLSKEKGNHSLPAPPGMQILRQQGRALRQFERTAYLRAAALQGTLPGHRVCCWLDTALVQLLPGGKVSWAWYSTSGHRCGYSGPDGALNSQVEPLGPWWSPQSTGAALMEPSGPRCSLSDPRATPQLLCSPSAQAGSPQAMPRCRPLLQPLQALCTGTKSQKFLHEPQQVFPEGVPRLRCSRWGCRGSPQHHSQCQAHGRAVDEDLCSQLPPQAGAVRQQALDWPQRYFLIS